MSTSAVSTPSSECSMHCCESHYSDAFHLMADMQKRRELCDVVLNVGNVIIHAHKIVLASTIPYFHAMFTSKNT